MAIQKADAEIRKKTLLWLGMAMVAGLAALQWGLPRLRTSLLEKEPEKALKLLIPLLYAMPIGLLLVLIPLFRLLNRTLDSGRFPPPDTRIIRDMKILEGEPARQRARQIRFFLILIIVLMVFATLLAHTTLVHLISRGV